MIKNSDLLQAQQKQILENIKTSKLSPTTLKLSGIIKDVLMFSKDEVYSIGDIGVKIRSLASKISAVNPHPDLFVSFDGQLTSTEDGSFGKIISDVLCILVNNKGVSSNIRRMLLSLIRENPKFDLIFENVDDPEQNLKNVRFVPSRESRDLIRLCKKVQIIPPSYIENWKDSPNNFNDYIRNISQYQSDIKTATDRKQHFLSLGLSEMAQSIQNSINELIMLSGKNQYYGFNKISIIDASIILAKQAGYSSLSVDCKNFKYDFWYDSDNKHDMILSPRAYPYHDLKDFASSDVLDIVDCLESFPEIGGNALFDHYRVVVPSFHDYPLIGNDLMFKFKLPNGGVYSSDFKFDAQRRLDVELIKQNELPAAVLGERDGEFYFVSYFQ